MERFEKALKVLDEIHSARQEGIDEGGKEVSTMIEIKYNENDIEGLEIFLRLMNKLGDKLNIKVM